MNRSMELDRVPDASFLDGPRMVLFDDDPFFVRMMEHYARQNFMSLTGVWRMDDIPEIATRDFDLAIVDFDLGDISGIELAAYLEEVFEELPLVMISHTQRLPTRRQPWPQSVRTFVLKENGPASILDTALKTHAFAGMQQRTMLKDVF